VEKIHHVHLWSLSEERVLVTLHAVLAADADAPMAAAGIRARLADEFGVGHATVELETAGREARFEAADCTGDPGPTPGHAH